MSGPDDRKDSGAEDFEELLATGIALLAEGGPEALERHLAAHPAEAPELRARLSTLQRLGMLETPDLDAGELRTIGSFRLLETLGRGGMSQVFLAEREEDGERVALKVLHTPFIDDPRSRLRFEREVLAIASLAHPCIVGLRESGLEEGRPWFAMELVEGATLDRVLHELGSNDVNFDELEGAHILGVVEHTSGSESSREFRRGYAESVCRIVLDVAEALEHAHRFGIVHRDVKPANIVIGLDGRAKLLDLGLASLEGSPALTRTGDFAGTPYYAAPEQAHRSQDVDGRADVFSLGVTLYEALTFRRPFEGRDAAEVFRNLQSKEPTPPSRLNPLLPRDLETVCLCALEKDRNLRYASMSELAADLQRFLEFKPVQARPIGPLRRTLRYARRHPSLSAFALLSTLVLIGVPIALVLVNEAIRTERDLAEGAALQAQRQAGISESVVDHLVALFAPLGEAEAAGEDWDFEDMLEASVARIPSELQEDPLVRAALLEAAGRIHTNQGRSEEALPLLDRAYALRQREVTTSDPSLAATLVWLSRAHLEEGNPSAARSLAARGLEALAEDQDPVPVETAFELRLTMAEAARLCGDTDRARRELEDLERACDAHPVQLGTRAHEIDAAFTELHLGLGELEAARARARTALDRVRAAWVPDLGLLSTAHLRLAEVAERGGDADTARSERALAAKAAESYDRARTGPAGDTWFASYPFDLLPEWLEDFDDAFQLGITALQTRRGKEAVEHFEACLRLSPDHPVCLYNLACASSIAGDAEGALAWLERAAAVRYGVLQGSLSGLSRDPDLALLREDPRLQELEAELFAGREEAWRRSATPRVELFDGPLPAGDAPGLIVVLTGDGASSGEAPLAAWRPIAARRRAHLLLLEGPLPGAPMSWIAEADDFLKDPWKTVRQPAEVVRTFAEGHELDRERVLLVGEGSGALVAFDLALRAPGFFRSTLLLNGLPTPASSDVNLARVRACEARVRVVLGDGSVAPGRPAAAGSAELAGELDAWFGDGGLDGRARAASQDGAGAGVPEVEELLGS